MGKRYLALLIVPLIAAIVLPSIAFATDLPDSVSVEFKHVNRNLLETGDQLFYFHYNLAYASYPTDNNIKAAFIFQMLNGSTIVGTTLAYPFVNNGYGQGVVGFYFAAADALTWGSSYTMRIVTNPAVFGTMTAYDFNISGADYSTLTTQADNHAELATNILSIAEELESEWSATLISNQDASILLSDDGELYFRAAIYGISAMAPSLFYLQSTDIDLTDRAWTTSEPGSMNSIVVKQSM